MTDSFGNEVASQRVTFLFVGRVLGVELCGVLAFVAADMRLPGRFKPWWKPKKVLILDEKLRIES